MNSQENDYRVASNVKTISNGRKVGGDYFYLKYLRSSSLYLSDFITLFNFDDYYCYKVTSLQRLISYEDFIEFKYSSYIFFKKELYNKEHIGLWIKWFDDMKYMVKPLPPFHPSKIIIKK